MPRPRKESQAVSLKMDKNLYNRLEMYCQTTYLTKTAAIEKALIRMLDEEAFDGGKQKLPKAEE